MIRQSLVERLNGAHARLQKALITGACTKVHRDLIDCLQADLSNIDAESVRAESVAFAQSEIHNRERTETHLHHARTAIASTLKRHPCVPEQTIQSDLTMTNQSVISAAKILSTAQARHDVSVKIHGESSNRVIEIQDRINVLKSARTAILERRRSSQLPEREAAGLIALNDEDEADLRKLLAAAELERESLAPNFDPVTQAQVAFDNAIKVAEFDVLALRAKEIESAFLAVVADVYAAGRSIGRSAMLGASWIPSKELHYMVAAGEPPVARKL